MSAEHFGKYTKSILSSASHLSYETLLTQNEAELPKLYVNVLSSIAGLRTCPRTYSDANHVFQWHKKVSQWAPLLYNHL